jgi:hypothetical protein
MDPCISSINACGRKFTIKTFNNAPIDVYVELNESFDSFVNNVKHVLGMENDKSLKFIYNGMTIDGNNFNNIEDRAILLCIILHTKQTLTNRNNQDNREQVSREQISREQVSREQVSREQVSREQVSREQVSREQVSREQIPGDQISRDIRSEHPASGSDQQPLYSYRQIQVSMIVFLDFVRTNPQVRDLWQNNYPQLVNEIIHNPGLNEIMRNIVSQSGQILKAMDTGTNIKVNINGDTGSVDEIELTKEDEKNINELIELGLDPTLVVKTYIENKNNKDKTLEKLLGPDN